MPRKPALTRQKIGPYTYWMTKAKGGARFGRVDEVTREDAEAAFLKFLLTATKRKTNRTTPQEKVVTIRVAVAEFLVGVHADNTAHHAAERERHLKSLVNFQHDGREVGEMTFTEVDPDVIDAWLADVAQRPGRQGKTLTPYSVDRYATSARAFFNWARRFPVKSPHCPRDHFPLAHLRRVTSPPKAIGQYDLPTREQLDLIFAWADVAAYANRGRGGKPRLGKRMRAQMSEKEVAEWYKAREGRNKSPMKTYRDHDLQRLLKHPMAERYRGFGDVLRVFHATGARDCELARARVRDYNPATKRLTLTEWKNARKTGMPRVIRLSPEATAIVERHIAGKPPTAPIFTQPNGKAWTTERLVKRFATLRTFLELPDSFSIYTFRHAFISEALMAGVDLVAVAKAAGNSPEVITRTYGHLSVDYIDDAMEKLAAYRHGSGRRSRPDPTTSLSPA